VISIQSLAAKGAGKNLHDEGTADVPYQIADVHLPEAVAVVDAATALDTALTMAAPQPTLVELWFALGSPARAPAINRDKLILYEERAGTHMLPHSPAAFPGAGAALAAAVCAGARALAWSVVIVGHWSSSGQGCRLCALGERLVRVPLATHVVLRLIRHRTPLHCLDSDVVFSDCENNTPA